MERHRRSANWRSPRSHLPWSDGVVEGQSRKVQDRVVGGSNPLAPTNQSGNIWIWIEISGLRILRVSEFEKNSRDDVDFRQARSSSR